MIDRSQYFNGGKITKTHGVSGAVVVKLNFPVSNELLKMESMLLEIDGALVPFFINDIYEQTAHSCIVSFDWYDSTVSVKEFIGCQIYVENSLSVEMNDLPKPQLIGYKIKDKKHGYLGTVQEILELPQHIVLQVLYDEHEILIPFNPSIVLDIIHEENEIQIELPEGLLDLYTDENYS